MGRQVYQESDYKVYRAGNDYIVHHSKYEFSDWHTHLKSLSVAKQVINCLIRRRLPKTRNTYVLTSIVRLADDPEYKKKIEGIIDTRKQKGRKPQYRNYVA